MDLHLVDEPALRYCRTTSAPPATRDILAARGRSRLRERGVDPIGDEGERRSAFFVTGSRAWWVRMNTGTPKGGLSPTSRPRGSSSHGPAPPLNMRLPSPRRRLASDSSTTSSSRLTSPPDRPWTPRQPSARKTHSWIRRRPRRAAARALVRPGDEAVERHRDVQRQLSHRSSSS